MIMGKTVTTAYACLDPPVTRNPWNLERTPGGSSSGSAAAVACGMCFGALGTQTGGSITRPASFCGVAGMKPNKLAIAVSLSRASCPSPRAWTMSDPSRERSMTSDHPVRGDRRRGLLQRREANARGSLECEARSGLGPVCEASSIAGATPAVRVSVFDEAVQALAAQGAEIVELDDPDRFRAGPQGPWTV